MVNKVRIIKSDSQSWYADKIGHTFEVSYIINGYYRIKNSVNKLIKESDCKIVSGKIPADNTKKLSAVLNKHYSGNRSRKFWRIIDDIDKEEDREIIYSLGCALQELESNVLNRIKKARKNKKV